jgi:Flp pilus assembly protein TadG
VPADPHPTRTTGRCPGQPGRQDGNALVLVPVGFLVVLALAAIAVDTALLHRAQAELGNAAAGLVNDAAAATATASLFDDDRAVTIDPSALSDLATSHAAVADDLAATCRARVVATGVEPVVTATCTGNATVVFRGVVGLSDRVPVTATATAELRRG